MTDPIVPSPAPAISPATNPAGRQTSTTAVISLVSGILGWSLLPFLGSIIAIITGHMARAEIRRSPDTLEGDGLAIVGLVLGWGAFVMGLVGIILLFVFFGGIAVLLGWLGISGYLH